MNFKFLIIIFLNCSNFLNCSDFYFQRSEDLSSQKEYANVKEFNKSLSNKNYKNALTIAKTMSTDFELVLAEKDISTKLEELDREDGGRNFTKEVNDTSDNCEVRTQIEVINQVLIGRRRLWRENKRKQQIEVAENGTVSFITSVVGASLTRFLGFK